jgi:hypothetical protein
LNTVPVCYTFTIGNRHKINLSRSKMETKNKLKKLLFAIGVFSLGMNLTCVAADYYVSPTGSNTNAGTTSGAAFKTITKAVSMVTAGGTVHVASGTYPETILNTKNGTATSRIRFVSDVKWGAKITPPSGGTAKTGFDNRGSYVTIDGFEIDGKSLTQWTVGINVGGESDSVINCQAHHIYTTGTGNSAGGAGILLDAWYGFNNMHAYNNVVHHIGPPVGGSWYQGIYQTATGSIKNNLVYAISGMGLHLWHDANHVDIINNTSFGNGGGLVAGGGDFVHTSGPCDYVNVINNIVFDNTGIGMDEEGSVGAHNVFKNNLSFQNGTNWRLKTSTHTADITADPQFVNYIRAGGGDYHLKSISPAIDKGIATLAPAKDHDGILRPQGTGYDIGAYEFVSNTTCTAPSVPNAPSNLTIFVSGTKIDLSWTDNSALESAYLVERSTDGITFTLVISLPANTTTFTNTGMAVNTKYYYRVMAKNCFGNSVYSNVVNATTSISTGIDENAFSKISVYPNPLSSIFYINIPADVALNDAVLKVYDMCGKEVKVVSINTNETIVDRGDLQNGIYFYQVINENRSIAKGKLVIQ